MLPDSANFAVVTDMNIGRHASVYTVLRVTLNRKRLVLIMKRTHSLSGGTTHDSQALQTPNPECRHSNNLAHNRVK